MPQRNWAVTCGQRVGNQTLELSLTLIPQNIILLYVPNFLA